MRDSSSFPGIGRDKSAINVSGVEPIKHSLRAALPPALVRPQWLPYVCTGCELSASGIRRRRRHRSTGMIANPSLLRKRSDVSVLLHQGWWWLRAGGFSRWPLWWAERYRCSCVGSPHTARHSLSHCSWVVDAIPPQKSTARSVVSAVVSGCTVLPHGVIPLPFLEPNCTSRCNVFSYAEWIG